MGTGSSSLEGSARPAEPTGRKTETMRVLMIAPEPFFEPRGTPFSILNRLASLTRQRVAVDLVTYPIGFDPDLNGVTIHRAGGIRQKRLVQTIRIGPDFPRHKTIRPPQELQVIIVKDVRLTLEIELRQRQ